MKCPSEACLYIALFSHQMALTIVVVGFLDAHRQMQNTTVPLGLRMLLSFLSFYITLILAVQGHVLFMNGMIEGDYFISVCIMLIYMGYCGLMLMR